MPEPTDADIDQLFPDLANILQRWEQPAAADGHDDPSHAGLTMEDFDNLPAPDAPFSNVPSGPPPTGGIEDVTPAPAPAPAPAPETEPAPAPAPAPSGEVPEPAAPAISPDEMERLAALRDEIQSDAQLRQIIADYYLRREIPNAPAPTQTQSPAPAANVPPPAAPAPFPAVEPPPGLDLDDPAIRTLYEQHLAQQQRVQNLEAFVQSQAQVQQANQAAQSTAMVRRASESFRQAHNLEQQDIEKLSNIAGRMQLIPALMSGTDPYTGLPTRPDPLAAVERALEIAYFATPEYRDRENAAATARAKENATRKQRLAAVQGSSGSVPRTSPQPPTNEQDRRSAMVRDMAAMMDGSFTTDN